MKISVVLGHPAPGSFNHAICATAIAALQAAGHECRFRDLYAERFDPVMPADELPKDAILPDGDRAPLPRDRGGRRDHRRAPELVERAAGHPPRVVRPRAPRGPGLQLRAGRPGRREADRPAQGAGGPRVHHREHAPRQGSAVVRGSAPHALAQGRLRPVRGPRTEKWDFSPIITSTADKRREWLREVELAVARYFPRE